MTGQNYVEPQQQMGRITTQWERFETCTPSSTVKFGVVRAKETDQQKKFLNEYGKSTTQSCSQRHDKFNKMKQQLVIRKTRGRSSFPARNAAQQRWRFPQKFHLHPRLFNAVSVDSKHSTDKPMYGTETSINKEQRQCGSASTWLGNKRQKSCGWGQCAGNVSSKVNIWTPEGSAKSPAHPNDSPGPPAVWRRRRE